MFYFIYDKNISFHVLICEMINFYSLTIRWVLVKLYLKRYIPCGTHLYSLYVKKVNQVIIKV